METAGSAGGISEELQPITSITDDKIPCIGKYDGGPCQKCGRQDTQLCENYDCRNWVCDAHLVWVNGDVMCGENCNDSVLSTDVEWTNVYWMNGWVDKHEIPHDLHMIPPQTGDVRIYPQMIKAYRKEIIAEYLDPSIRGQPGHPDSMKKKERTTIPVKVIRGTKELQIWKELKERLPYEIACAIKQYTLGSTNIWKQAVHWQCAQCMQCVVEELSRTNFQA